MFDQAVTTISVRNLDASLAFYTGTLGFRVVHQLNGQIVHLAAGGMILALRPRGVANFAESTHVHIGLMVSDLDATRRSLERRGVDFIGEPVDSHVAKVTFFTDPDGTSLYLCQWLYWAESQTSTYDLAAI